MIDMPRWKTVSWTGGSAGGRWGTLMQGSYLDCCGNEKRTPGRKRQPLSSPSPFAKLLLHRRLRPVAAIRRPGARSRGVIMPDPLAGRRHTFCACRDCAFPRPYRAAPARAMKVPWLCCFCALFFQRELIWHLLNGRLSDLHDGVLGCQSDERFPISAFDSTSSFQSSTWRPISRSRSSFQSSGERARIGEARRRRSTHSEIPHAPAAPLIIGVGNCSGPGPHRPWQ